MAKKETTETVEETTQNTTFTAEQLSIIQSMLQNARNESSSGPAALSVYNTRDPQSIETVNVKRVDGKFVIAFKNFQKDKFKKTPQYLVYKSDPTRGLHKEPYITLILSEDGVNLEEQEMMLIDYMNARRDSYKAKVLNIEVKKIIEDFGYLGRSQDYATMVDERGMATEQQKVLAQVEREERVFTVELPGFEKPVEFISDYLA